MGQPYVTALVDTYNHERFIEQAITSVLEQDVAPREMEVLVVDDGSTDRTGEIARRFEPRVRYLRKENGGQASAFNFGIPQARGQIVAFCDGDDWWAQDKLSRVLRTFDEHHEAGMVGHGVFQVDAEGKPLGTVVPDRTYFLNARTAEAARQFDRLKGFFGATKVAYRKSLLDRILPIPEEIRIEADEFLWTLGVALSDAIALEQPLFYYRFHGQNFFMQRGSGLEGARRKHNALTGLVRHLPGRLAGLGVAPEIADALLESLRLETEQLRLFVVGGTPLEMFRAERAANRLYHAQAPLGYRVFKALALALTLVMPPRAFCRLKQAYAAKNLRRFRKVLGEPAVSAPVVERRVGT